MKFFKIPNQNGTVVLLYLHQIIKKITFRVKLTSDRQNQHFWLFFGNPPPPKKNTVFTPVSIERGIRIIYLSDLKLILRYFGIFLLLNRFDLGPI